MVVLRYFVCFLNLKVNQNALNYCTSELFVLASLFFANALSFFDCKAVKSDFVCSATNIVGIVVSLTLYVMIV